ncbi:MAG TPA: pseudouridine synthase [Dehalococcoidia bacterium]|nr:pseudouridine synthase [Dehalococcoidia bacterium]
MTTLLRAVSSASGLSRRKAFAAIREGRVRLDGVVSQDPSSEYETGDLSLDGVALGEAPREHAYLLLNKPPGYVTTLSDDLGRATVMELVPAALRASGLHPVGRLDRDTSGLLLLTNDGDFTYALTHPSHEVEKEYWLRLAQPAAETQLDALRSGVELDGRVRRPLRLRRLVGAEPFQLSVTLREGRRRQVRRMFEAVGCKLTALRRVREGSLTLGSLPEGAVRALTRSEVAALRGE